MKPLLVDAVPEWNTESLDPLKVNRVIFKDIFGGLNIKGNLEDITITGLGSYKISGAKSNLDVS